ncbi:unnamed protein product, partial [Adineta ricciae]
MPTWTVISKKQNERCRRQRTVWIFKNDFYVEHSSRIEKYQQGGNRAFIESIKQNKSPQELVKTPEQSDDECDYYFEDMTGEQYTSLSWDSYESQQVELQEYNPQWPNLFQQEYEEIVKRLPKHPGHEGKSKQSLLLEMEHIGSTSVKGMCAKPIIDMLLIHGNIRSWGVTKSEETFDTLIKMGYRTKDGSVSWRNFWDGATLIKNGFIIHTTRNYESNGNNDFIIFSSYLRNHAHARERYNAYKKRMASKSPHVTVKEYTSWKDQFIHDLLAEATNWYRQHKMYVHIGNYDQIKKQWTCCKASQDERNGETEDSEDDMPRGEIGCYQPGLDKDHYHPGRYYVTEYNFVRGWWTCCSQGRHSDGCVKVKVLGNGDVLLGDHDQWDMSSVCRWVKSFKDINKDYSDSFREHGINGHLLLTSVDDEVLRDLGVSTVLHRKLFLKGIDELRGPSTASGSKPLSSLSKESKKSYYEEFRG